MSLLKVLLAAKCEDHHVAARLVASSDDIDRLATEEAPDIAALHGWRREVFGEDALALKQGRVALGVAGQAGEADPGLTHTIAWRYRTTLLASARENLSRRLHHERHDHGKSSTSRRRNARLAPVAVALAA